MTDQEYLENCILGCTTTNQNENLIKKWDKTYRKCYWPNFYRYEVEADGEKGYYHIYINNEEVERCPLQATKEEVDMRFHELLEENWIEDDNMYEWKEVK